MPWPCAGCGAGTATGGNDGAVVGGWCPSTGAEGAVAYADSARHVLRRTAGLLGFATETAPIDEDLTIKALQSRLSRLSEQTISHDVLGAFVDLSPEARWAVVE